MAFDRCEHIPLLSFLGMCERTIRIGMAQDCLGDRLEGRLPDRIGQTDARGVKGSSVLGLHDGAELATLGGV